jgi:hypothetical protein
VVCQPVAALMANGLKTGLVVDVGENIIDVAPVYQGTRSFSVRRVLAQLMEAPPPTIWWLLMHATGHCLQYAAQRLEIARGHGLTGVLRALLNENREPNQRLRTTSESQKVRRT